MLRVLRVLRVLQILEMLEVSRARFRPLVPAAT
jgi:hypothetical protein